MAPSQDEEPIGKQSPGDTFSSGSIVGEPLPPLRATITEDAVRRYCRAVDQPWNGRVPWLFLASLGADQAPPSDRTDGLSGRPVLYPVPGSFQRNLVGGMEWEFGARPNVGDELTISARFVSVKERQGQRSGTMFISVLEMTFTNQLGEKVAVQRLTRVHR